MGTFVITHKTKLSEILNSEKVKEELFGTLDNFRQKCTFPRNACLKSEIAKPALKDAKINGSTCMSTAGSNVKNAFDNFHKALGELQKDIEASLIYKEKTELNTFITALDKEIRKKENEKDSWIRKKNKAEDESEKLACQSEINDANRYIESYEKTRKRALDRLSKLGAEYTPTAGETTEQTTSTERPEADMVSYMDHTTNTYMEYDANNPGVRTLTYTDYEGNEYEAAYSYDDNGNPVCVITNLTDETSKTYSVGENGVVTIDGGDNSEYAYFQYFCIENAETGSVVEVPILVTEFGNYAAMGYGMGNGDLAYISETFSNNITSNYFAGSISNPYQNTKQEVYTEDGTVTEYVYYQSYQTNPYGYSQTK